MKLLSFFHRIAFLPVFVLVLLLYGAGSLFAADAKTFTDKTIVVWAAPDTLDQKGGSAFTIDMANPDSFDGAVFAELEPGVWMPGSTFHYRTCKDQSNWVKETVPGEYARIAIVYRGYEVKIYRNDTLVAAYNISGKPQAYDDNAIILFGPRHALNMEDFFVGRIKDARLYSVPLTAEQISALEPGKPLEGVDPWVWFDFAGSGLFEKTGRFNNITIGGDARIEDGALVLGSGKGTLRAMKAAEKSDAVPLPTSWDVNGTVPAEVLISARKLREKYLADPYRPRWHFAIPEENGMPGDPNGCFWANGEYHLMYLYMRTGDGFSWAHLSSNDLVHWRHHPDAIVPSHGEDGCFSGGGFIDSDGTAWLSYWQIWHGGIGLTKSQYPFDKWEKLPENPVVPATELGLYYKEEPEGTVLFASADPSNIWKKGEKYYMLTGNYWVLDKFGRAEDSPQELRGDYLDLFESADLKTWVHKGKFYQRNPEWTDESEDDMCPSFLPLATTPEGGEFSGKHLLLFISHNKGCQYYVGKYDTEEDRFYPESHGRMTRVDNTYFAPEALVDDKGRQIMWAWIIDNRKDEMALQGWSGVYGLPRVLWCGEDGTLRMKPVPELEVLRWNEQSFENLAVSPESPAELTGFPGDSFELELTVSPEEAAKAGKIGVTVMEDKNTGEKTLVYYDAARKELVFDGTKGGNDGRPMEESLPFALSEGEPLRLRVFVDHSIIEVYANDRQAIGRRSYPSDPNNALGVSLFSEGGSLKVDSVRAWEMKPANPY